MSEDNWKHRAANMRCSTCMWWVAKEVDDYETRVATEEPEAGNRSLRIGRCRNHSPTIKGFPATFPTDWCGDHKLDETKL